MKKSIIDRFKVKRSRSHRLSQDSQKATRHSSFTGTDEKSKDTLDVFRQFEVSKSLPSSPVSRRKKKNSLRSRGSPETYSGISRSSGSPFTGGATTEDSQHSTPLHVAATVSGQNKDAPTQQEVAAGSVVGQEIQIKVDVEDDARAPITAESTQETVEASETTVTNSSEDTTKPVEPVQSVIAVEQESVSPGEPSEPVDAIQKDIESPVKSAEPVAPAAIVVQESSESKESIDIEKEKEGDKIQAEVAQGSTAIQDGPEGTITPVKPVEPDIVEDKEPEQPALSVESALLPAKDVEEDTKSEKPAPSIQPDTVGEIDANDAEKKPDKPVLPVKPVATKEKDTEKSTLPVKPAFINEEESERESAKPAFPAKPATHIKNESKPVSPAKRVVIVENEVEEKPFIPKYLKDRLFQWDKIREILETAPLSTEEPSYSELPPQEDTWTEHSSPMEQLRAFLVVCP